MRLGLRLVIDRVKAGNVLEKLGKLGVVLGIDGRFQHGCKNVVQVFAEILNFSRFGNNVVYSRDLDEPAHVRRVDLNKLRLAWRLNHPLRCG